MKKLISMVTLVLVVAACGGDGGDSGNAAFGEVTVTGSLTPFQSPTTDDAVGTPSPTLAGVDQTGAPVEFTPGTNPSLVLFLAHWCPHCQADLPRMVEWLEANPDRLGVDVIAVATGTQATSPNYPPGPWLEREGWDQPLIMDDEASSAGLAFGLTSYPFWVAVGSDGNVLTRVAGELGPEQIDSLMQAISES